MSRREEDRRLWKAVARTVTRPISRQDGTRAQTDLAAEMHRLMESSGDPALKKRAKPATGHASLQPRSPLLPPAQSDRQSVSHPIEERVLKRLARGRHRVDGRIDLHGYTQDRARGVLLEYLHMARVRGDRLVLVITGKGNADQGVLRRNVPLWLETPPFAPHVNGWHPASHSHGGAGALYVRLRRAPGVAS
jgi:DNA-nicking Smr family endonuclease